MLARIFTGRTGIAPLITLRIVFGVLMCASLLRFTLKGWITELYVKPGFHFPYWGFEWVKPFAGTGMHAVFALMIGCTVLIALGALYRVATVLFFLLFTYVELIDVTTYLNHYYFISLVALLLCFVPAHRAFSLDVRFGRVRPVVEVPSAWLRMVQLQMALVYFFAGIAKINGDWLLEAMPLRIWLHARSDLPVIGGLLQRSGVAFAASWAAMLFDTLIAFFLFPRRTAVAAYAVVVVFHALTALLFPGIGMFPFIMMAMALVFVPVPVHERLWTQLGWNKERPSAAALGIPAAARAALIAWFAVQFLVPFRYLLYPGRLFYNEEGYRFSWRVMLMEKAGAVFFTVKDPATGRTIPVDDARYLTELQRKQMCTQPDLILRFAHHLRDEFRDRIPDAEVHAEAYVSVNGHGSRPFIDPAVDLAREHDGFAEKKWVYDE
ncbi:MAG TPA: HTTM domain-containing protein [Flavobacteriales bacterium]